MAASFHFEITTPERTVLKREVVQVTLPTREGEITVLAHHIPLVSLLVPGELRCITPEGDVVTMAVSGGFIEVQEKGVAVLADTAERVEEIDADRAAEARERARKAMQEAHGSEAMAEATAVLEKHMVRLRVAERHRRHTHGKTTLPE